MTRGGYQAKPPLPFVPGMEAAGTVVAVGAGAEWEEGARVIVGGLTGCAQFGVHATDAIVPMPDALSFPEAAALRAAYLTAWVALVRCGAAQPGQWVLIHGAAGGVGLAAVDLARALGLRVIAVASSEEKRRRIADLYAPEHVLAGPVGFREAVLEITGGRGADLVYDPVGGDAFDESTRCIAFGGRLLVVGFASGRIPDIRANIPLIKGFSVVGVRAGSSDAAFPIAGRKTWRPSSGWPEKDAFARMFTLRLRCRAGARPSRRWKPARSSDARCCCRTRIDSARQEWAQKRAAPLPGGPE
jgi:NADPH2:quinone reductase